MSGDHDYLSTACFHEQCGQCRRTCKFCGTPCSCHCHLFKRQPVSEPVSDEQIVQLLIGPSF